MSRRVLLAGTDHHIENHAQMTHEVCMQGVAGTAWLVRVVTYIGSALLAEQRLDGGVDVQYPGRVQSRLDAGKKLLPEPIAAHVLTHPAQRPAQRVFADDLAHAKDLRTDSVAAQSGDMRIAMMPGEDQQEPSAKYAALVRGVVAAVGQRATRPPGLVDSGGGKKLGEKSQLSVGVALAS